MNIVVSPGATYLLMRRGGIGPAPTLGELAVMVVATIALLWVISVPVRWLMNLWLNDEPDTLLGVVVGDFWFFCRAMGKIW